jgi:hypothetical protein
MRRIVIAALVVALLALPAASEATSIHNYTVRDAGPEIVHKVTFCSQEQWWWDVRIRIESEAGQDRQRWRSDWEDRTRRVCNRVTFAHRDGLMYEGWYFSRMRVSIPGVGWVRYTGWRRFWSS